MKGDGSLFLSPLFSYFSPYKLISKCLTPTPIFAPSVVANDDILGDSSVNPNDDIWIFVKLFCDKPDNEIAGLINRYGLCKLLLQSPLPVVK